jgi:uncharacterized phage protein gp47/JayE
VTTPVAPTPTLSPALQPPANIDYTSKDWNGFINSMLAYASVIMPEWNTVSEGDFGVALLEMFAYPLDILSYYGDRIGQEAYLPTATQRLSLLNIAALLGYTVSNGAAAVGTVTFVTANPGPAVTIPAGTQVATDFQSSTDAPIIFQTDSTVTCGGNGATVTANVTQGITFTQIPIGTSSGLPGQTFQIPQAGVIDGSVQVFVQTNTAVPQQYAFTQFLVDNGPSALVFTTFTDATGLTNVEFGDNLNGIIPTQGLVIYASYTIGVGTSGNVAAGVVGEMVNPIDGVSVQLEADGQTFVSSQMSGGADPETNDQIRTNAPQLFATQQRAVSLADFEAMAQNVPGVTVVSAVGQHSTSVSVYALGPDFQPASTALQNNISAYFNGKTLAGVTVTVAQPTLVPIDVGSSATPVTLQCMPTAIMASVLQNVQTALTALFQPPNISFGELINVGQVYQTILSVAGVQWVVIPVITREDVTQTGVTPIQLRGSEVPTPGNFNNITVQGGI